MQNADGDVGEQPTDDNTSESSSQPRRNPFSSQEAAAEEESSFKAMFIVRFLGCKKVGAFLDTCNKILVEVSLIVQLRRLNIEKVSIG